MSDPIGQPSATADVAQQQEPPQQQQPTTEGLFASVSFHIITTELNSTEVHQLRQALLNHGATEHTDQPSRDAQFELDGLSHIIATTVDFEGYEQVEDSFINVVRPDWVLSAISKGKLPNPKQFSADPRMMFSGLVVCIASDIPEGEKDALIGGVLAMGGLYAGQMSRQVTHVVALGMAARECRVVVEKKLMCQIVLPHWFDDCLRLSRRIDEGPYKLPNPALLDGEQYELKKVERPDMATAMYLRPGHLPDWNSSENSRMEELDVFEGKKILLHSDLDISDHLRSTLEDLITVSDGKAVSNIQEADVLVCQWREGPLYRIASQQGKVVGNLSWLYHLISHNKWTSPFRRLLHYPFAKEGIPGFKTYKLSLSNYSGEARVYLENLAKAAGSTFTKAFKTENTHLVTAHERSEKVDAAKEWGIHIINHLWLEDCYAKWAIQPVNFDRYTYMPPKTNMGEVVGQTPIDREALEKHFYPKGPSSPIFTGSLKDSQEEDLEPAQEEEVFMTAHGNDNEEEEEAVAAHVDQTKEPEMHEDTGSVMQDKDANANIGRLSDPKTPAPQQKEKKKLGRPTKSASKLMRAPKTPIGKAQADDKENEVPRTTGSRSAKSKAKEQMHSMVSDIELFQREMKRVGGVTHGGKRAKEDVVSSEPRPSSSSARKRSASAEDGPGAGEEESEDEITVSSGGRKRARGSLPAVQMRLLITGWGGGRAAQHKAALRNVGIMLTDDAARATHVAASRIIRTEKFMCALAYGPTVVSTQFVEDSLARGRILDPAKYPLKDKEGEKRYGMNLAESLKRARESSQQLGKAGDGHKRRKIFDGAQIYISKDVNGGYDTFAAIVSANGGTPFLFQGRPGAIKSRRADSNNNHDQSHAAATNSTKTDHRNLNDLDDLDEEDASTQASDNNRDHPHGNADSNDNTLADTIVLACGDGPAESRLADRFREMAAKANWGAQVVGSNWVLDSGLAQEVRNLDNYPLGQA